MRIRTDGDKAYRNDLIARASDWYGCNKTDALMYAADDVPELVHAASKVLDRDDLTREQRREIAETFNDGIRGVSFDVDSSVSVTRD